MKCKSFKNEDLEQVLMEYLNIAQVPEWLYFEGTSLPFKFHWSSWHKSSRLMSKLWDNFLQKSNQSTVLSKFEKRFVLFSSILEQFKDQPVWINKKEKTIASNTYELYSLFLDSRAKIVLNLENQDCELMVSLGHEHGPYVSFTSLKWFDPEIFKIFVLGKILLNNMPLRNFRIETDLPTTFEIPDSSLDLSGLKSSLTQLGKSGALLTITSNGHSISQMHKLNAEILKGAPPEIVIKKAPLEAFFEELSPLLPKQCASTTHLGAFKILKFEPKISQYQNVDHKNFDAVMTCFVRFDLVQNKKNGESLNEILSPCLISLESKFEAVFNQYFGKKAA